MKKNLLLLASTLSIINIFARQYPEIESFYREKNAYPLVRKQNSEIIDPMITDVKASAILSTLRKEIPSDNEALTAALSLYLSIMGPYLEVFLSDSEQTSLAQRMVANLVSTIENLETPAQKLAFIEELGYEVYHEIESIVGNNDTDRHRLEHLRIAYIQLYQLYKKALLA